MANLAAINKTRRTKLVAKRSPPVQHRTALRQTSNCADDQPAAGRAAPISRTRHSLHLPPASARVAPAAPTRSFPFHSPSLRRARDAQHGWDTPALRRPCVPVGTQSQDGRCKSRWSEAGRAIAARGRRGRVGQRQRGLTNAGGHGAPQRPAGVLPARVRPASVSEPRRNRHRRGR